MKNYLLVAVLLCVPFLTVAHAENHNTATENGLKIVAHEYVCMVNDRLFPNVQIPVIHGGKTYYGCCPMCKERLAKDVSMRRAKDPVSHRYVDKADAVIGALPSGKVLYFENVQNLKDYK